MSPKPARSRASGRTGAYPVRGAVGRGGRPVRRPGAPPAAPCGGVVLNLPVRVFVGPSRSTCGSFDALAVMDVPVLALGEPHLVVDPLVAGSLRAWVDQ